MCSQLTPLARYDQTHQLAQCAHGTVHFIWKTGSLRLHPRDVIAIATTLATISLDEPHTLYEGDLVVFVAPDCGVNVWLGSIGLALSYSGFALFCDLFYQAAATLRAQHGDSATAPSATPPLDERTVTYTASTSVSNN